MFILRTTLNIKDKLTVIFLSLIIICCTGSGLFAKSHDQDNDSKRTVQFSYNVLIKNIPSDSKHLEILMPVPKSDNHQTVSNFNVSGDYPYTFRNDPKNNNLILVIERNKEIPDKFSVSMDFLVTRIGYSVSDKLVISDVVIGHKGLKRYLLPDRLIPVNGVIADEARKILDKDMIALEKARVLYNHVVSTMTYDKSGKGWGRGDAIYACDARKGNCTDFHSLFIGMARASGIPSRFVIGFPIPDGKKQGEIHGYHCWAEFYIDGLGWIPIDASEASKHPEKQDFFFGSLDANRVQFTTGRDIHIEHNLSVKPLNYFIYPYVQIDSKAYLDVEYRFWFEDLG